MNKNRINACAAIAAATAIGAATTASAADYTWMASPADANWNTTSLNWNSGEAWVDNALEPNNAIFGSSSQMTANVVGDHIVSNLTLNAKDFNINGSGKVSVAGTVSVGAGQIAIRAPLASGRADGSLHFTGGDWHITFLYGGANTQTSTYLDGSFFGPQTDSAFGVVPSAPTENIFVTSLSTIFASGPLTVNRNRILKLKSGASLMTGSNHSITYKNQILAENTEGYDYSRNTYLQIRDNWNGLITLDPGAGVTNAFGRLQNHRYLKLASGVTYVTGPGGTDTSANLYVCGNKSSYASNNGNMLIDGGELYSDQGGACYVDVRRYGQVTVTNGGKVYMPNAQWLNGLDGPGRLIVANGGEFTVNILRLTQSVTPAEVFLLEGGTIRARQLFVDQKNNACDFHFNGGTFQALAERSDFLNKIGEDYWKYVHFLVEEKGAVFDMSNNVNAWWTQPLVSGVAAGETDGGLRLFTTGSENPQFVMATTNDYNGATVVDGKIGLQVRVDYGLPTNTTLRLSGGADLQCNTYNSESPARQTTNWVARIEGYGNLNSISNLHITDGVAPSIGQSIGFAQVCDLRGDFEISGNATTCGSLWLNVAGQDISGLRPKMMNADAFDRHRKYTVIRSPHGHDGTLDESGLPGGWHFEDDGSTVVLRYSAPFTMIVH